MKKNLFDDLARTLATPTPMPRRQALRAIGATLALSAFGALRPGRAVGQGAQCTRCFVAIKYGTHEGGCCRNSNEECCVGPNYDKQHPNQMSWCCGKGNCDPTLASGARCTYPCPPGTFRCGKGCCRSKSPTLPGQVCYTTNMGSACRDACPANTVTCGNVCCSSPQLCRNGKCCDKCAGGGTCCDPATTMCCGDPDNPTAAGICCKKTDSCCGVGPGDAPTTRMCCPATYACVRQFPQGGGGWTKSSPIVCCPPARQVPADDTGSSNITGCCYPGQVSLGGKLIVGAGIQGLCCDANKICNSGANLTCCQTGQSCIGGTTCA